VKTGRLDYNRAVLLQGYWEWFCAKCDAECRGSSRDSDVWFGIVREREDFIFLCLQFSENLIGREHSDDEGIDGKIILNGF
jgi:hypothetical protein